MARSGEVAQLGEMPIFLRNAWHRRAVNLFPAERAIPAVAGRRDAFGRDRADARCAAPVTRADALQIADPPQHRLQFADGVPQGADGLLASTQYVGISYRHMACSQRLSIRLPIGVTVQSHRAARYFRHHRPFCGNFQIARVAAFIMMCCSSWRVPS